jgi:probable HAF family extracellular repeat protein
VTDVSADGSVVVGYEGSSGIYKPFRWEDGVTTYLGPMGDGGAYAVSADGSVTVGGDLHYPPEEGFRWDNGMVTSLGDLPGGSVHTVGLGISADGSVVIGRSASEHGTEAFRWENGQMTGLGDLPGNSFYSLATDISADGSVIVGIGTSGDGVYGREAFRWEDGVMTGLGQPFGPGTDSQAIAVSADGSVIVGCSTDARGFRWDNGVATELGYLPDTRATIPHDVSGDGSIVVGECWPPFYGGAFFWTAEDGMRHLEDVLVDDYGLDLTGWSLTSAEAISDDGKTIIGNGGSSEGGYGWIATIPEPATGILVAVGAAGMARRRRTSYRAAGRVQAPRGRI